MKGLLQMTRAAQQVRVWDIGVRLFHWSFAAAVTAAWLTHVLHDRSHALHVWIGYAAVGLVAARLLWGFVGTRHARFADFIKSPLHVVRYTGQMISGKAPRHLGHNPLGALMVLALLALVVVQATTGYVMTHRGLSLFGLGHRQLEELHGLTGNLFLILVPLHILGVVVASLMHRENLVAAMITGRKRASA